MGQISLCWLGQVRLYILSAGTGVHAGFWHVRVQAVGLSVAPLSITACCAIITSTSFEPFKQHARCSRYLTRDHNPSRSSMALRRTFSKSRYVLLHLPHRPLGLAHIVACTGPQSNDAWWVQKKHLKSCANLMQASVAECTPPTRL